MGTSVVTAGSGGNSLTQHIVEFVAGTGIITDGVTDATDTASPFNWTVPFGVSQLLVDMCGAGGGGSSGADPTGAISVGAGGGGGSGASIVSMPVSVLPGAALEIGIGAAGTGGSGYSTAGGAGGYSYIVGIRTNHFGSTADTDTFTLEALGGGGGSPNATASGAEATNGASGGASGLKIATIAGGSSGASGGATSLITVFAFNFNMSACQGSGGGGGASSGAVNGGGGGYGPTLSGTLGAALNRLTSSYGVGDNTGTLSRGGGGGGGYSWFGNAGKGGAGGSNGDNAIGYGAGGGGAGGGADTGGNGAPGYVRFTFWS